jgi:hypothetical protein
MFRILISLLLIAFLFVGIISTADVLLNSEISSEKIINTNYLANASPRDSIKEIEILTANENYSFTSKNFVNK